MRVWMIVADDVVCHAVPRGRGCIQHLLRKTTSGNGRDIRGCSSCRLFCLHDRVVGD